INRTCATQLHGSCVIALMVMLIWLGGRHAAHFTSTNNKGLPVCVEQIETIYTRCGMTISEEAFYFNTVRISFLPFIFLPFSRLFFLDFEAEAVWCTSTYQACSNTNAEPGKYLIWPYTL